MENQEIEIKTKKFRLSGKSFFLTYPQCPMQREHLHEHLKGLGEYSYVLIARELHQDGHHHLHVLIQYIDKKNIRNAKFFDVLGYHGNYQTARDTEKVREYLLKADETPLEYGMYASNKQSDLQKRAKDNKKIIETDITQLIDSGVIHVSNIVKIKQAKEMYNIVSKKVPDILDRKSIWIYGGTGIGKSWYVRQNHPMVYYKPQNEWWDGYNAQPCVCIDDLDDPKMGHFLKIWGDRYSFSGQVKGSSVVPGYTTFIITSNYRIAELFPDERIRKPLERRFTEYTIKDGMLWDEMMPDDIDELVLRELL